MLYNTVVRYWREALIGALALAVFILCRMYIAEADAFMVYKAGVIQAGEAAARRNALVEIQRRAITRQKEEEYERRYKAVSDKYAAARKRLRDAPGSSGVPALSAAAGRVNCPDGQADLARGLGVLESEVLGLLERGDRAIERTITCREWIESQQIVR